MLLRCVDMYTRRSAFRALCFLSTFKTDRSRVLTQTTECTSSDAIAADQKRVQGLDPSIYLVWDVIAAMEAKHKQSLQKIQLIAAQFQ